MQCRTRGRHPALHVVMRWRRDAGVQVGMQAQARARVSAARRAAHLHSALLLPSSAARPPRWQRQLVWDVRHAASCATSSIFSRSAICYLFPRCSRRGYRFKHTYVTDAGVADWRHDMENRAYRRDRLWIGSLKTWGSCPWSDSQLRPRRGPTALIPPGGGLGAG